MACKTFFIVIACASMLTLISGCASRDSAGPSASAHGERVALSVKSQADTDIGESDDDEQEIALSDVPRSVIDAALAAVPGIALEEATMETEGDAQIYELEGEANGQDYEIEVSADGKVLEIEAAGGDDDHSG